MIRNGGRHCRLSTLPAVSIGIVPAVSCVPAVPSVPAVAIVYLLC